MMSRSLPTTEPAVRCQELERRRKQLAGKREQFEFEEFERTVERVRLAEKLLDAADRLPIADVDLEGYATLMREIRRSAHWAILGPRNGKRVAREDGGSISSAATVQ